MEGVVVGVSFSPEHTFVKSSRDRICLLAGLGVEGDAHCGVNLQHVARGTTSDKPNRRQVHLIHAELHDELRASGFDVNPGQMGENVTTRGIDLLSLPTGTLLHLGEEAVVEVTGLRNPCAQLDGVQQGLLAAVLDRDAQGNLIRKSGVMGIVIAGGEVSPGDAIRVTLPAEAHQPLVCV